MSWWHDDDTLRRFVGDLVSAELAVLRPTAPRTTVPTLDVDSLELVVLATALNEALHLHESGVEELLLARPTLDGWVDVARRGLDACSERMTFRTSGSTGEPKRCEHTLAALSQEVDELAPMFAGQRRVLSAVRCHHIYGFLFTVLLPRTRPVVDLRNRLPVPAAWREGDLVIGHPEFWRAVAGSGSRVSRGIIGVTSTAPCPDDVAHRVVSLGLNALVQVYGSSETAGVGVRFAPDQPYALLSFWERSEGNAGALVRVAPDGPRALHALPDLLEGSGDREFLPVARHDDAIQVAGVNVFPLRVRQALLEHPDVDDAAVRYANELWRLKAFVVPRDGRAGGAALHALLEEWVVNRLSAPERPKAFSFGNALPRDAR